jgi:signal transduction histidine kinase
MGAAAAGSAAAGGAGNAAGGGEAASPGDAAGGGAAGDAAVPGDAGDGFGQLLDYHRLAGSPPISSQLSAPLFYDGEFLGMLEIAAWQRPAFAPRDLQVVERFLPAAAVAMRNARVNRSLEMQAVEAEVKATLVTLSHAVAHDVNNAVGSILPLAQQMRFDLRHGETLDLDMFDRDLGVIIDSARLCQRIFSNMLRVAGSGRASDGPVDAAQVVAETMPLLLALAARRGIEIALDLAPGLPAVRCRRQDLQHIVLNLVRNSLQALGEGDGGGRVEIALQGVQGGDGGIELAVTDNGPGIPAELLSKVQEPFFSTRPGGSGLGLSICRALAWQNGGSLTVESPIGGGGPAAAVDLVLSSGLPASAAAGWELTAPEQTAVAACGTRVTLRLGATPEPARPQEVR